MTGLLISPARLIKNKSSVSQTVTKKRKEQHSRILFFPQRKRVLPSRTPRPRVQVLNPAAPMEAAPSETEKEGGCAEMVPG